MLSNNKAFLRACDELGIKTRQLSGGWVLRLEYGEKKKYAIGNNLGLNSEAAMVLATDKVATIRVLEANDVPVVRGWLVRELEDLRDVPRKAMVVKPNNGLAGKDVLLCENEKEVREKAEELLRKYETVCVSEYERAEKEYRCFYLDGEILGMYAKIAPEDGWKHNLSGGAGAILAESREVEEMAARAGGALGMRFATVDILETAEGLKVLEVNAGVAVRQFLALHPEKEDWAVGMYRKALWGLLG